MNDAQVDKLIDDAQAEFKFQFPNIEPNKIVGGIPKGFEPTGNDPAPIYGLIEDKVFQKMRLFLDNLIWSS